ncbi:MAG: DsbA family protein [Microgenomates group bacterium]
MRGKKIKKNKSTISEKSLDFKKILQSKSTLIIFLLVLIIFFFLIKISKAVKKTEIQNEILPKAVKKILQNDKANIEINNLKEVSGLYEFQLTLKDQNNQKFISYITKDGKILFTSGIKIDELFKSQNTSPRQQKKLTCNDLKKDSKPKLTAYIMANCPYGLQMQRVFKNLINTDNATLNNLRVEYIFNQDSNFENGDLNSLHGKEEAQENLRQICIREEQSSLYWPYVSCYMQKENNSENCLTQAGVNTEILKSCMNDKNRGLKYATADFENTQRLGVSGSPTLVLNDSQIVSEFDFGGRNPNAIKEILCCSADKKLAYCNKEFSKNNVAISFSQTDEQVAGRSTGGGCN